MCCEVKLLNRRSRHRTSASSFARRFDVVIVIGVPHGQDGRRCRRLRATSTSQAWRRAAFISSGVRSRRPRNCFNVVVEPLSAVMAAVLPLRRRRTFAARRFDATTAVTSFCSARCRIFNPIIGDALWRERRWRRRRRRRRRRRWSMTCRRYTCNRCNTATWRMVWKLRGDDVCRITAMVIVRRRRIRSDVFFFFFGVSASSFPTDLPVVSTRLRNGRGRCQAVFSSRHRRRRRSDRRMARVGRSRRRNIIVGRLAVRRRKVFH